MEGIVPSLSGVGIKFPPVSLFSSGPIWDSETLEEGSWSSVEGNISNSFKNSVWVEILGIDVVMDIWFLVEFVRIEVFDSNTYIIIKLNIEGQSKGLTNFSGFFNVETISNEGEVGMNESECV